MSDTFDATEQRVHARLQVATEVSVATPDGLVRAALRDLSKGGARFTIARAIGSVGDTVELVLPTLGDEDVVVTATIVRAQPATSPSSSTVSASMPGGFDIGVRFDSVDPEKERALLELIDHLMSLTGGGQRRHPRVARRIAIRHGKDRGDALSCISRGGMELVVLEPLVLFEDVSIAVPDAVGDELLILRGRVVRQQLIVDPPEEGQPPAEMPRWRVGIEFAELRPEARACLDALLALWIDSTE